MRLEDRVAVVTGGGSGFGAAICRHFAVEGAKVFVLDINGHAAERLISDLRDGGHHVQGCAADVTDRSAMENAADQAENELGPVDIWVNCAGISRVVPFLECTEELWDQTLTINLKGTFVGCQAAVRRMLPRKRGVVLNMSSQSGKVGNSHYAAYCASKFGVIGLTQSLAAEYAGDGIRVNALCPGVAFTPLWESMIEDYARKRDMRPEEVKPYLESRIPLGRLCSPEDVARVAVFLACDEASYMTGQAINITGGALMH